MVFIGVFFSSECCHISFYKNWSPEFFNFIRKHTFTERKCKYSTVILQQWKYISILKQKMCLLVKLARIYDRLHKTTQICTNCILICGSWMSFLILAREKIFPSVLCLSALDGLESPSSLWWRLYTRVYYFLIWKEAAILSKH